MNHRIWIEMVGVLVMVVGLIGILVIRFRLKKGIGRRAIQAMTVVLLAPAILILGLENVLTSETIAAIVGGMVGYVFSGVGAKDTE